MSEEERVWSAPLLEDPHNTQDKAERIRRMFDAIAPTYERVNSVCSAGTDRRWRKRAVQLAKVTSQDRVLDVACGTGDFARAFAAAGPQLVVGCDFSRNMLALAAERTPSAIHWCEADAQKLPFRDAAFTLVSCAFGVRNFQDLPAGLAEMHRVLEPGGRAVILEFTRPRPRLFRAVYELYCGRIMPVLAGWISRDKVGAYRYLPRSVVSFLDASAFRGQLLETGFSSVMMTPLTLGSVTIYVADKHGGDGASA